MSAARILQLSPRLANQIAAGEVVERPASVVKELLENSLDAGATRIEIEIERGGIQLIRISDNGDGIHPDDLALALARHATSKISTLDDLDGVLSLGFRGEALASIASVAKLLLVSRRRGESNAWQAFAEGAGMQVQVQPAALTEGTRIDVRDLFFNTPARRRFLRSEATEFAHIDDTVRRVALARPDVAITLKHNGRGVRQLRAGHDQAAQAARVSAVLGRGFLLTAAAIDAQIDRVHLAGFVGHPDQHRAQADGQYVFVNGRAIRDRVVSHAIRAGFADTIPAGRAPCYALFLQLPATDVDVNVHPTKHEVRFRNARWLHDWLTRTVAEAVARCADQINTETGEVMLAPVSTLPVVAVQESRSRYSSVPSSSSVSRAAAQVRASVAYQSPSPSLTTQFAATDSGLALQRVAADLVLQWSMPARVWRASRVLAAYLQTHWLQCQTPALLPLLLPVTVPLPMPLSWSAFERLQQGLQTLGFGLQCGQREPAVAPAAQLQSIQPQALQLHSAPAVLRGAEWPRLLESLAAALPVASPAAQGPAASDMTLAQLTAAHLLQQPVSQQPGFWQPIIAWAIQSAPEHGKSPSEQDWSALWSR